MKCGKCTATLIAPYWTLILRGVTDTFTLNVCAACLRSGLPGNAYHRLQLITVDSGWVQMPMVDTPAFEPPLRLRRRAREGE